LAQEFGCRKSAFVTKTESQLNDGGLAYRKEKAMPPS